MIPNFGIIGFSHITGSHAGHINKLDHRGIIAANGFEGLKPVEIIDKIYKAIR